ncbi:response regulator transcription factor [Streptococcus thoraltensis]|uniref:response regulator transcription factor n=1 Tax=Streptococcus thoraltensis TaxID=55085 RepID=UPI001F58DEA9|nr:response regulator transcription factor [Streptococcus thoraltensis]
MYTIYVADDEKSIRDLIKTFLQKEDMDVKTFETGDQLLLAFMERQADLVVLDVMMPGTDGFSIARKIRQVSQVPIFLLTALDSDQNYIDGFKTGIDDYFTKPFSPIKLALRIKAILARQPFTTTVTELTELSFEGLRLMSAPPQLMIKDHIISLTNTEYKVMKLLLTEPNRSVSREQLLDEVWGIDSDVETRVTDDTMKRLRQKLRQVDSHVIIETVWGYGFKLSKKEVS